MRQTRQPRHGMVDPELIEILRPDIPPHRLDTQRQLKFYVVPGGRRLTEYEALNLYAQQGTDWASGGFETADSMQKWPGGRPTYAPETTEIKTTDWWRFRDPAGKWFYPMVKEKSEEGRSNDRFMKTYSADGTIRTVDPYWLQEILGKHFGAYLFYEYGLFNAHASVVHDCLSDIVRVFFSNIVFDKNDAAQLVQTQRVFIHKMIPQIPASLKVPKQLWLEDPVYAKSRQMVEEVWEEVYDHMEAVWAIHGVVDAIFGQFVRREFYQRMATHYGDSITPWFLTQVMGQVRYAANGVRRLYFADLMEDPKYGAVNRRWIQLWTKKWLPKTLAALGGFLAIYDCVDEVPGASDPAGVRAAVSRVLGDWVEDFGRPLGLGLEQDALVEQVFQYAAGA